MMSTCYIVILLNYTIHSNMFSKTLISEYLNTCHFHRPCLVTKKQQRPLVNADQCLVKLNGSIVRAHMDIQLLTTKSRRAKFSTNVPLFTKIDGVYGVSPT